MLRTAFWVLLQCLVVTCGWPCSLSATPRPATPITITANAGRFGSIEAAAVAERRVDWWDAETTDDAACTESFAAIELRRELALLLGIPESRITLASADRMPRSGTVFLLGSASSNPLVRGLHTTTTAVGDLGSQGFHVYSRSESGRHVTVIEGGGRVGTLYGVYALLERLGVRFYGLGDSGTVRPGDVPSLPETLEINESPWFETRGFWAWEPRGTVEFFQWMARNRLNLWTAAEPDPWRLAKLGIRLVAGGHVIQKAALDPRADYPYRVEPSWNLGRPADPYRPSSEFSGDRDHDGRLSTFEVHPEWFGLVQGRRSDSIGVDRGDNFCTSNRDATRELFKNLIDRLANGEWRRSDILAFWMLDDGRWCECDSCRAIGSPTDRLLRLQGEFMVALRDARAARVLHRPVRVTSLAFLETLPPPRVSVPEVLMDDAFAMTFFPIRRCYAHAFADPSCLEINASQATLYSSWSSDSNRAYRGRMEVGEYYGVDAFHSLPIVLSRVIAQDVAWYANHGARHFHYMHVPTLKWGPWTLSHALLARLLWNPRASAEPILDEYFDRYYAAASEPMRRVYERLEFALGNLKILKHEVQVSVRVFQLRRQLRLGGTPFALQHFRRDARSSTNDDGPDLAEMVRAMNEARADLQAALRVRVDPTVRARLEETRERFEYADATVAFFAHLLTLCEEDRAGRGDRARTEWRALEAAATRLRGMRDVVQGAGSHANAADGLEATGMTDWYETFRNRYAAGK